MIELIPLKEKHCEQVYEIAKECLPEHWSLEGVRDVLKYDNNIYFVAIDDSITADEDCVVGFCGIMIVADEAELLNIAVKKEYRRQEIASSLIDKLLDCGQQSQCSRILLEVRSNNHAAIHLYKKKDFTELAIRKNYYSNPSDDAIIMERIFR